MPDARPRRLTPRVAAMLGSAGVLAVALSGCAGAPAPTPTPTVSASAAPIFASDEEALAAAEAAYERFLAASAQATSKGGPGVAGLAAVASGNAYVSQVESVEDYLNDRVHSTGRRTFATYALQSVVLGADEVVVVSFYVCDDLRGLDVLREDGSSVVASDRVVDVPYLVVVEGERESMKVSEKALWERENFCL